MAPGPRPHGNDRAESAEARAERRARSLEEPLDIRLTVRDPYPILEVRNPIHRTAYLVLLPEFPSDALRLCTCTDFARRGLGTCKHVEAAFRWLSFHPNEAPPAGSGPPERSAVVWPEIDRRLQAAGPAERRRRREIAATAEPLLG
jgi:hypothetical protein